MLSTPLLGFAFISFFDPSLLILVLVGVFVGVTAALLGIGGGLLMVPALNLWGATPLEAIATSLVGIFLSSTSGTIQNWRMRQLKLERVVLLAPPAMLTTELGVWIANKLPSSLLLIGFAGLQVASIYLISLKKNLNRSEVRAAQAEPPPQTYAATTAGGDVAVLQQPAVDVETEPDQPQIFRIQGIGLLAGVLSGLFGIGGGIIMVPLQMLFLGETIKSAVRTSLGAIALISIWAVGRHALSGNVLWSAGICLGIGGLLGAQFGARLLPKLPDRLVSVLFRGLLLLLATYMVVKAIQS